MLNVDSAFWILCYLSFPGQVGLIQCIWLVVRCFCALECMDETDITIAVVSRTMPLFDVSPRSPPVSEVHLSASHPDELSISKDTT